MKKATSDNTTPRWRRSAVTGTLVGVRLQPDELTRLDAWIVRQGEPLPSRPEALRRLAEVGLASAETRRPIPKKAAAKAKRIAAAELDQIVDRSTPKKEQQRRKQRLLKGPPEFRDLRKQKGKSIPASKLR